LSPVAAAAAAAAAECNMNTGLFLPREC